MDFCITRDTMGVRETIYGRHGVPRCSCCKVFSFTCNRNINQIFPNFQDFQRVFRSSKYIKVSWALNNVLSSYLKEHTYLQNVFDAYSRTSSCLQCSFLLNTLRKGNKYYGRSSENRDDLFAGSGSK